MITTLLYILSIASIIAVCSLVLIRRESASSLYFGLMSLAMSVWLSLQFFALTNPSAANILVRLGLVVFSVIPALFLSFIFAFTDKNNSLEPQTRQKILYLTALPVIALSLFPGILRSVSVEEAGLTIEAGAVYTAHTIYALLVILFGCWWFFSKYSKLTKEKKKVSQFLIGGILLAAAGNVISGLLYAGRAELQFFGPLSVVAMVSLFAYSMGRHKLFDIRAAAARTFVYAVFLLVITAVFFLVSIAITDRYAVSESASKLINLSLLIVFVSTAPYAKRVLDKLSHSIFYQDAYDPQVFLDELIQVLSTQTDLKKLYQHAAEVMTSQLNVEFAYFVGTDGIKGGSESSSHRSTAGREFTKVLGNLSTRQERVIVVDRLESGSVEIRRRLSEQNVGAVINLRLKEVGSAGETQLFIGMKKNGTAFNSQDIRIFEIMASELLIAIENVGRYEEIRKFSVTLQEKINNATKELQESNEKLKALDETKDEFISMASHQLRTPLTSVKGYLSMVLEGDAGSLNEQQQKLLNQAFTSSQRMVYLIADLLNVSRLRTGKFVIEATPSNLADVIEGEVGQLKETAHARGLELSYEKPQNFPTLYVDETKIRQVIMNFIDNAIYYTPAGGHITVSLTQSDQTIEFKVVDDGLGVPKAEQHHLFTKFYRAKNARRARPDGTGLGLFMAKKVIVAQGGAIIFRSQEGKGSTFGFTFPMSALQAPKSDKKP